MDLARISELLIPFLGTTGDLSSEPCHSESGQRPVEARLERSRRESILLSPEQLQHISTYIDLLLRWNARINLTAIRDPEEIVTRHFGESLFAARHLFPEKFNGAADALVRPAEQSSAHSVEDSTREEREISETQLGSREQRGRAALQGRVNDPEKIGASAPAARANAQRPTLNAQTLADLGSGAGFPGIPIKLWAPEISLTLIESNHKKSTFLREVARSLTLTNIDIQTRRAELSTGAAPLHLGTYQVVTLRAVERFSNILPTSASLVAPGGRLALLIGATQVAEASSTLATISWSKPIYVPLSQSRVLLIGSKEIEPKE